MKKVAETKKKLAELQDDDKKKIDNERKLVANMKQILEQTETEYDEKVKKEKERRDAKIEAIYEYMEVVFEEDINQSDRELNDQEHLLVADLQQAIEESDRAYEDYVKEQKEIRDAKIEAISETYFKGKEAMMKRRERADLMITKTKEQNKTAKRKYIEMVFEEDKNAEGICTICAYVMLYPKKIFRCVNLHSICSDCKVRITSCAECRDGRGYFQQNAELQERIAKKAKKNLESLD